MRITKTVDWTTAKAAAIHGDYLLGCLGCRKVELISGDSIQDAVSKGIVFNASHQACKRLVDNPDAPRVPQEVAP